LLITKQDVHLDDPYLMSNVITIAQFLLTGSAFCSSLPPAVTTQPAFVVQPAFSPCQQQPTYAPSRPSPHVTPANLAFNLVAGIKVEAMQAIHPPPLCKFCVAAGHFTCTCVTCMEYLNAGKVIRGTDGRFYMPDGSKILCITGGQCLKDAVDFTLGIGQPGQPSTSANTSAGFSHDQPPHVTASILFATYPETPVVLDIDLSMFILTQEQESDLEDTDNEFKPYFAKVWASFQADRAAKDKGKCVQFDGVQMPPQKRLDPRTATVSEELCSPELQKTAQVTPSLSSSCPQPSTSALCAEPCNPVTTTPPLAQSGSTPARPGEPSTSSP